MDNSDNLLAMLQVIEDNKPQYICGRNPADDVFCVRLSSNDLMRIIEALEALTRLEGLKNDQ